MRVSARPEVLIVGVGCVLKVDVGELSDQLQLQLQRLYKEAAKYTNSCVDGDTPTEDWNWSVYVEFLAGRAFADWISSKLERGG
jgi:hypothetical protein